MKSAIVILNHPDAAKDTGTVHSVYREDENVGQALIELLGTIPDEISAVVAIVSDGTKPGDLLHKERGANRPPYAATRKSKLKSGARSHAAIRPLARHRS